MAKSALLDHDYSVRFVTPEDLSAMQQRQNDKDKEEQSSEEEEDDEYNPSSSFSKRFSKCDSCRRSRTKVLVPNSVLSIASGKNDGVTCDFCGEVMTTVLPPAPPEAFEGRRGSRGGGEKNSGSKRKQKDYVYCRECGKVVLKESLVKHIRDVHELSNKKQCHLCDKVLSGPFSLREHIDVIHREMRAKFPCPQKEPAQCRRTFAHLSNLNRHVRLVHDRMVVAHKYVDCRLCRKVVQATSLKKHMSAIHERRRDFACGHCDKRFTQSYTLKEHVAAKHTLAYGHRCGLCGKAFAHKTNCVRHVRTVHRKEVEERRYADEQEMIRDCCCVVDVQQVEQEQDLPSRQ